MATFDELIAQIDENVHNNRDRGTLFENLVVSYLVNGPYSNNFSDVWMLNKVPEKYGISKQDTGVDIVARNKDGSLTAVQAKFYKGKVSKDTINSFIAEASKKYYSNAIFVTTSSDWTDNAHKAFEGLEHPVTVIGLEDLRKANVNWQLFDFNNPTKNITKEPKGLRKYQQKAVQKSLDYFEQNNRGKLVMAPGTGKTFTSLKIAEALMDQKNTQVFNVLYLVPSIQLLSQTLFAWNTDISPDKNIYSFSVVSDKKATRYTKDSDDIAIKDIGFPSTTDADKLVKNYQLLDNAGQKQMRVVFSTYQSISVLHDAQEKGFPDFDLIIADEAHRTTGSHEMGDPSTFTMVHYDEHVRGALRLYQTATPRIYAESTKQKVKERNSQSLDGSIVIASMDDENIYGTEIYRFGFGEAVSKGALTDYKVIVIGVNEGFVNKEDSSNDDVIELPVDDKAKIIGIWNAMVKRTGDTNTIDGKPMKRAIAFTDTIEHSLDTTFKFKQVVKKYLTPKTEQKEKDQDKIEKQEENKEPSYSVEVRHADGSFNALEKKEALNWLSGDIPENKAHILSNVRFLTEGIDVPNLDAVIFFTPKKSQVDIVQAVGRIMRKFEGKDYGYIILPIVLPAGVDPNKALDNNKNYKHIWQVLNALRSTDERFEAIVNQIDLNKYKPDKINFIGINSAPDIALNESTELAPPPSQEQHEQLSLPLAELSALEQAFYGMVVQKVGDRRYLEDWSKDVADIAKRHINKINALIDTNSGAAQAFEAFLTSLQNNINSSVDRDQAVEMLSQHLITQPIFEALFKDYSFAADNPVSKAMNDVIGAFKLFGFDREQKKLEPFYESVRLRASGIDNAEARQKMIVTLYDKFFQTGFKKTTEQLGIVFTPVEVVDFIVKSVDWVLNKHFNKKSIASEGVHILDPFTGTGTFITRTLHYLNEQKKNGRINFKDIKHKYEKELHANEIVLLSYYIAAINIESVFDEVNGPKRGYEAFNGIVLTDTFASTERGKQIPGLILHENNERLEEQQKQTITAIIGNPPYSVGQKSANDNNQNLRYPKLEERIQQIYAALSTATSKKALMDSYIKAFRWATDRLGSTGVIGFVTNGAYLDSNSADGFRASLYKEFNHLYIFNLRGNALGSGEPRRKEGGNVFGEGTRTSIAISILVKDGSDQHKIYYHDIGDGLSRQQKLKIISDFGSIADDDADSKENIEWDVLVPDENNDWLNQRDPKFQNYPIIAGESNSPFILSAIGVTTNRDAWVIGFNKKNIENNVHTLIDTYNTGLKNNTPEKEINDDTKINWSSGLRKLYDKHQPLKYNKEAYVLTLYRPFTKKWMYFDKNLVERPGKWRTMWGHENVEIYTSGRAAVKGFSTIATDAIPNLHFLDSGQGFMRYDNSDTAGQLLSDGSNMNQVFADSLGLSQDDAFAYVYGLLHSPEYRERFASDLQKDLARIPTVADKEQYVDIGKKLMDLHINYETVDPYPGVTVKKTGKDYRVEKMRFAKNRNPENRKLEEDKSTIIFNPSITISGIPEKAYEYVVNGRSAIEWIMDQYQIKVDKRSGIVDDPNGFSEDEQYILKLLLSVINVSVQTVDLVKQLPKLEIIESD